MKIKILTPVRTVSAFYKKGDTATVSEQEGLALIKAGLAESSETKKTSKVETATANNVKETAKVDLKNDKKTKK